MINTTEELNYLIALAECESRENSLLSFDIDQSSDLVSSFVKFILEIKIQIDRWDLNSNIIVVHSCLKDFFCVCFKNQMDPPKLWGMDVIFSDLIDKNKILIADIGTQGICRAELRLAI